LIPFLYFLEPKPEELGVLQLALLARKHGAL
jgi:hypothetical protein